jgi:hypothetical protein
MGVGVRLAGVSVGAADAVGVGVGVRLAGVSVGAADAVGVGVRLVGVSVGAADAVEVGVGLAGMSDGAGDGESVGVRVGVIVGVTVTLIGKVAVVRTLVVLVMVRTDDDVPEPKARVSVPASAS